MHLILDALIEMIHRVEGVYLSILDHPLLFVKLLQLACKRSTCILSEVFLVGALSSLTYNAITHVSNKHMFMFIGKLWFVVRICHPSEHAWSHQGQCHYYHYNLCSWSNWNTLSLNYVIWMASCTSGLTHIKKRCKYMSLIATT